MIAPNSLRRPFERRCCLCDFPHDSHPFSTTEFGECVLFERTHRLEPVRFWRTASTPGFTSISEVLRPILRRRAVRQLPAMIFPINSRLKLRPTLDIACRHKYYSETSYAPPQGLFFRKRAAQLTLRCCTPFDKVLWKNIFPTFCEVSSLA